MRKTWILFLLLFLLGGCVPGEPQRPWNGYALNRESQKYEFFFSDFETVHDCQESMRAEVTPGVSGNAAWYSQPVGCVYSGNSYWWVWLMNSFFAGDQFGCINSIIREDAPFRYGISLKGQTKRDTDSYCV